MPAAMWSYLAALIPFIGGGVICYVVIKAMIEGDRNERKARQEWADTHSSRSSGESGSTPPEE